MRKSRAEREKSERQTSSESRALDLGVRDVEGVSLVNSQVVAERFEKRHADVLRDISKLEINAELRRSWFRPTTVADAYGRPQPAFDLTRDGFTLLAMGWTGEKALQFKVAYIEEFNRMVQFP